MIAGMRRYALALSAAALGAPVNARAQAPDCGTRTEAPWTIAWSPIIPLADPGRGGPVTPASLAAMPAAAPRVGLLWSAGTPATVAGEVDSSFLRLAFGHGAKSGAFRRPLDPGSSGATGACGLGWQPVGSHGAAVGHVLVQRGAESEGGTSAVLVDPYSIDPLVPVDSAAPNLARSTVLAEGAIGWRWGAWSAGVAVGFAAEQVNTDHARIAHLDHVSIPGLTLGVARRLPWQG
jgi:hypothetical protein